MWNRKIWSQNFKRKKKLHKNKLLLMPLFHALAYQVGTLLINTAAHFLWEAKSSRCLLERASRRLGICPRKPVSEMHLVSRQHFSSFQVGLWLVSYDIIMFWQQWICWEKEDKLGREPPENGSTLSHGEKPHRYTMVVLAAMWSYSRK